MCMLDLFLIFEWICCLLAPTCEDKPHWGWQPNRPALYGQSCDLYFSRFYIKSCTWEHECVSLTTIQSLSPFFPTSHHLCSSKRMLSLRADWSKCFISIVTRCWSDNGQSKNTFWHYYADFFTLYLMRHFRWIVFTLNSHGNMDLYVSLRYNLYLPSFQPVIPSVHLSACCIFALTDLSALYRLWHCRWSDDRLSRNAFCRLARKCEDKPKPDPLMDIRYISASLAFTSNPHGNINVYALTAIQSLSRF